MRHRIQKILNDWIKNLNKEEAILKVFEKVRDIPYGFIGSRDPIKVYDTNKGTCSGKHLLLTELYEAMGLDVKHMLAFHKYQELPRNIEYPQDLQKLLQIGSGIPDYHNYIKMYLNGNWLTIDATFELSLKNYFVVNEWSGQNDTRLSVKPIKTWQVESPVDLKIKKLKKLPPKVQDYRKEFLDKFSQWLDLLRKDKKGQT